MTEGEWLVEGLKESEEMSDEVEVAVRERGVVIETAACSRRRALTPRLKKVKHKEGATLEVWRSFATVGDRVM